VDDANGERTALLEYVLSSERAILFVVTREGFQVIRLGATAEIRERVERLRAAIAEGPLRAAYGSYIVNARTLYQALVQPAEKWLAGKQELIVVPDGILYYLPFEVLLTSGELTPEELWAGSAFERVRATGCRNEIRSASERASASRSRWAQAALR